MSGFGNMLNDYLEYHKISQSDFADRLGITQKHMNEIINGKTSLSIDLILAISLLTNIDANLIYYVETKKRVYDELINEYKNEKEVNKMLNSFYINEMNQKKWLKLKDKNSFVQKYLDLIEFLNVKNLDVLDNYLEKRFLFKKREQSNDKKIYLWIKHCDSLKQITKSKYSINQLKALLNELKNERCKTFDKYSIIKLFAKYGIVLYIEDALEGTKIRGCIKIAVDTPTIYMTTYYKEKSSFYFTLYHELMHLKHDYNKLKKMTIIDNNDDSEIEIDNMAINEMIPEDIYFKILKNYQDKDNICIENKIPLCFLYTRLAKEGKIKYNSKEYLNNIEKIS